MYENSLFRAVIFPFAFAVCSCNKGSSDTKNESSFTWTYDGKTYKAKQDTAFTIGIGAPSIVAGLNTGFYDRGSGPRINVTSLTEGPYSFGSGTGHTFRFIDEAGDNIDATSGTLNITKNTDKLLSGDFNVSLYNSKIITGIFSNTPIRP
jgi:hypothetical protein